MRMLQTSLRIAAALFISFMAASAYSQALSVSIPNCNGGLWNQGNTTLTCATVSGTTSGASCSLSSASVVVGTTAVLTATCTSFTPVTYSFTPCTTQGAPSANQCSITSSNSGSVVVALTATDANGVVQTANGTATFSAPNCTIAGAQSGRTGTTLTFNTACNFTPDQWTWTGCDTAANAQTCTINKTVAGTYAIGVTATNTTSSITDVAPSINAVFSATTGSNFPSSCTYNTYPTNSLTPVPVTLKTSYANGGNPIATLVTGTYVVSSVSGSVVVAQIKVPATGNGMSYAEYGSIATPRIAYASKTPCDMTQASKISAGNSATMKFHVGQAAGNGQTDVVYKNAVFMAPGSTWYIMIVNYGVDNNQNDSTYLYPTTSTCTGSKDCSMILSTY